MKSLIKNLTKKLIKKKLTLGLAESCTGGLIASHLTSQSGASNYFLGCVVSYANEAKHDLLGVKTSTLKAHGAVSEQVALAMARGARKVFKSSWSVSVTGIAGPLGGTQEKPVGLVYFALVGPKFEEVRKMNFSGNRNSIQKKSAKAAIKFLLENL